VPGYATIPLGDVCRDFQDDLHLGYMAALRLVSYHDDPPVEIVRVPAERLDELEPLWSALYEHHHSLTPHLASRARPLSDAWRDHVALERQWLVEEPGSFVLGAEINGRLVGYAFVRIVAEKLAVSWTISNPYADLTVLSVLPELRGRGIGAMLMDATNAELQRQGIRDVAITVITTNTDAERLYKRRGAVSYTTVLLQQVPVRARSTTPAEPG
jgi:ribosomal protein S18 acetylase RimI-like enzyme